MLSDCCAPACATPQTVSIPGAPGLDGLPGTPGSNGASTTTALTANLVLPNTVGQNVTASIGSSVGFVVGQPIFIKGPANFTLMSIASPTSIVIRFESAPGDLAFGSTILSGAGVATGANEVSAYTILGADLTIPAVGSPVTATVAQTAWMGVGQYLMLGTVGDIFKVTSITDRNTVVLTYQNLPGNTHAGATITKNSFAVVIGPAGLPAYSTTTSSTVIPAVGSPVTVAMVNSAFLAVSQATIVSDGTFVGHFQVVSFPDAQHAVMNFLGYTGDSAPAATIASGARVSVSGILVSTSIGTQTVYGAGTAYTLTTTPALVGMGTTTPSLIITAPGTYLLMGTAVYSLITATQGTSFQYTTQIQQQAHGAGPFSQVGNSATVFSDGSYGGADNVKTDQNVSTPPVIFTTANNNDVIQLWVSVNALTGGSTPKISACSLVALKLA